MLPDLDSGPGAPLHESMAFAAAVVPVMLIHHLLQMGFSHEMIILICAGLYLLIRFGGVELLKFFTEHRGMFHSLPAAAIFGEIAYLLASGDTNLRLYKAGAVVLGYMSHLFLDEVYSFEWSHGRLRLKSSFGTALKIFGHGWWPNISAYAKLAILIRCHFVSTVFDRKSIASRWPNIRPSERPCANAIAPKPTPTTDSQQENLALAIAYCCACSTDLLPSVQKQRDRPVVYEFHFHVLAESARGNGNSLCGQHIERTFHRAFRPTSGGAAASKLGRRPLRQSPRSVNWLTTNIAPSTSLSERFIFSC